MEYKYYADLMSAISNYQFLCFNIKQWNAMYSKEKNDKNNPITEEREEYICKCIKQMEERKRKFKDIFSNLNIPITDEQATTIFWGNKENVIEHCTKRHRSDDLPTLYNYIG
ncbi:MAG: hypothetical protein ACOCQR_03705 [bacterium]